MLKIQKTLHNRAVGAVQAGARATGCNALHSANGSRAALTNGSPTRASTQGGGEFATTLKDAQHLVDELSSSLQLPDDVAVSGEVARGGARGEAAAA